MSTTTGGIAVKLHQGRILVDYLARFYDSLSAVVQEMVQNSIDAGATRVDTTINLKSRCIETCDNGKGASREKIEDALTSVGNTMKTGPRQYGQFGLGNFASLSIGAELTITSCPEARTSSYTDYLFVTETIRKQGQVVIPEKPADNLTFDPQGKTWWRTRDRKSTRLNSSH